ncbi:MAG: hypothetical protein J5864_00595, partial [Oscillospiraceae bacterium]|nr:hypothetical protein [Oscillospiraceae bacterium]
MKTRKTLAFATAALTAFMPLSYAGTALNNIPALSAEEQAAAVNLPEWVPSNFKEALDFRNRYGATHIEDGFLCVLFTERNSHSEEDEDQYSVIEGTMVEDGSGIKEEHGLVTMELYHHTFTSDELDLPSGPQFEVVVYKAKKAGEFNVRLFDKALENTDCIMPSYSFSASDKLEITETDLHAWIPDCSTEFENYKHKYGEVGTYEGKYLTFCMESNAGTPYNWTDFGNNTEGGILGNYGSFDCSPVNAVPLEGGKINTINVYFPEKDGPATVSWKLAKTFGDEEIIETLSANCVITDDAGTILTENNCRLRFVDSETGKLLNFPNIKEPMCLLPTIG